MKLSIATPTFGNPRYLEKCIQSVVNQSIPTMHIVCGGNLSFKTDIKSDYYKIIEETPDPGMVGCWNKAANLSETEYIAFLADDNMLVSNYAETMVNFLDNHPDCDLVFCNQYHMEADDSIDQEKSKQFTQLFGRDRLEAGIVDASRYESILKYNSIPMEACVIRKETWLKYGPFLEKSKGSFDMEFLYRMLLNGVKIGFVPEYLMNFRWHEDAYCTRERKDHIIGSIWTTESLMAESDQYRDFFKEKSVSLKGLLLRYKLKPKARIDLMLTLIKEKKGLQVVVKNTIAKFLGKK